MTTPPQPQPHPPTKPVPDPHPITGPGRPLEGIRVLSMEQAAALPFATRHLADLGATIIRVESPDRAPVVTGTDLFRNKQRIALDLSQESGPEAFRRIAATCHIVAHNYTPRVMRKYGIDYPSIKNIKPDIIYLSLTGFGTTGPWGERPLFGPGAEAISGQNNLIGEPDAWPGRPGTIVYADNICGLHAITALLAALERLQRTGLGQHIDISLYETAISQIGPVIAERALGGNPPHRTGNADPRYPIHHVFPTNAPPGITDRHIAITATTHQLPQLLDALQIHLPTPPTTTIDPEKTAQTSPSTPPNLNHTPTQPQPTTTIPVDRIPQPDEPTTPSPTAASPTAPTTPASADTPPAPPTATLPDEGADHLTTALTDALTDAIAQAVATRTADEVAQLLQTHHIPASPVHDSADHLADPHLWARNYFGLLHLPTPPAPTSGTPSPAAPSTDTPSTGTPSTGTSSTGTPTTANASTGTPGNPSDQHTYPTAGPVWGGGPPNPEAPHHIGADTSAVLLDVGYTPHEVDAMFESGAAVDRGAHAPARPTADPQIRIHRGELTRIDPLETVRHRWTTTRAANPPTPLTLPPPPSGTSAPPPPPPHPPRVLDITPGDIATAYATKLLAEVGYDVVRLDSPHGDPFRILPSRWGGAPGGTSTFLNYGKRNLLLQHPTQLEQLAAAADIVIGDFSQTAANIGEISPHTFATLQPKAAVVSISPFGLTGPNAGWAATDITVQAASSLMFLTGEYDQPPQQLPPYAAAMTGGLAAAGAAIAALLSARHDGQIRRVDVAHVEAMAALTYSPTSAYAQRGEVARREQRIKQALRMVPASDRFVYCAPGAVGSMRLEGVARLIDEPRLAEPRFQTAEGRMQNYDEYLELFVPPFQRQTAQEWFEQAEALHLTFALVQTIDDLFSCPQLAARNMLREVPGPDGSPVQIPGRPFRLEDGPAAPDRPAAATPGEHTEEVLRDWLNA